MSIQKLLENLEKSLDKLIETATAEFYNPPGTIVEPGNYKDLRVVFKGTNMPVQPSPNEKYSLLGLAKEDPDGDASRTLKALKIEQEKEHFPGNILDFIAANYKDSDNIYDVTIKNGKLLDTPWGSEFENIVTLDEPEKARNIGHAANYRKKIKSTDVSGVIVKR